MCVFLFLYNVGEREWGGYDLEVDIISFNEIFFG